MTLRRLTSDWVRDTVRTPNLCPLKKHIRLVPSLLYAKRFASFHATLRSSGRWRAMLRPRGQYICQFTAPHS